MDADSESETEGVGDRFPNDKPFELCTLVRDIREELGRRIQRMSVKSALTIADRLRLAYYQNVLRLYEPLSPETLVHAGYTMGRHCSGHQKEVGEINQILDYLIPRAGKMTTGGAPPPGSLPLALPESARRFTKKGRPVTRRPAALLALQLHDTGQTWFSITQEVCDCGEKEHNEACTEAIRQGVIGLKRFLRQLGIEVPKRQA